MQAGEPTTSWFSIDLIGDFCGEFLYWWLALNCFMRSGANRLSNLAFISRF